MSRILTVTANTAIDYCIEIDQLSAGDNVMAKSTVEYAAGKGINVAKTIESLQFPVTTLGFVGNQSLDIFAALGSQFLQTDFTSAEGKTRTNITLVDNCTHQETHIRTNGFDVTADDCNSLIEKLKEHITTGDVVVLSGSLPPGAPTDLYPSLIELCHNMDALPLLDTSGESLIRGLRANPYLIKPNQKELEEIIGRTLNDEKAIVAAARDIISQGTKWVVVSRGKQGIIVVSDCVVLAAMVKSASARAVSTIGCGDALVAGMAVAMLRKNRMPEVIESGLSCAAANLFSNEPGRIDPLLAEAMQKQIVFRSL